MSRLAETWEKYGAAWSAIPDSERRQLLDASVQDSLTLATPQALGAGRQQLESNIKEFQKSFPGASFQTLKIRQHHEFLLVDWIARSEDGRELLPGTTYAQFGADGRIMHLTGFWEV
ncbi:nuclear transport factor 2 family protein [Acidipila sp. EB88]|uniref:nuclear transport factor 2 family protein n=1 Tax=Acidipila sp. EB88 TaxID=2305226 RepID=UPI000F5EC42C|nr:nuclear transport factor 2 family protein [Acidipila sp. EB88]